MSMQQCRAVCATIQQQTVTPTFCSVRVPVCCGWSRSHQIMLSVNKDGARSAAGCSNWFLSQRRLRELARLLLEGSCWVVTHVWNVARNAIFTARCQALFSCYRFLFYFNSLRTAHAASKNSNSMTKCRDDRFASESRRPFLDQFLDSRTS
jgi:hypothetical protein